MMVLKIIVLVVLGGLSTWLLIAGWFYTLLTSGGDRGGDSGIREAGCLCLLGAVSGLILFALVWTFA